MKENFSKPQENREFIKVLTGDEQTKALIEAKEKARLDLESFLSDARYEGRLEGLRQAVKERLAVGEGEAPFLIARHLIREWMPLKDISQATGLTLEEIQKLIYEVHG